MHTREIVHGYLNLVSDDISNLGIYGRVNLITWELENWLENCTPRIVTNIALSKETVLSMFRKLFYLISISTISTSDLDARAKKSIF